MRAHLLQLILLQTSLGLLALDLVPQKVHMLLVLLLHPGCLLCLHIALAVSLQSAPCCCPCCCVTIALLWRQAASRLH